LAQRDSRKRRKRRQRASAAADPPKPPAQSGAEFMARGYARGRAKDEEARAKLVPLRPGERPGAVTVAFWFAVVLAVANAVFLVANFDPDKGPQSAFTVLVIGVLGVMAYGLWHARYWAALGMQTLLALTILAACLALIGVANVRNALLLAAIVAVSGALFWYLIKAMARLQMPERPGGR
jgi:hypothetical protein